MPSYKFRQKSAGAAAGSVEITAPTEAVARQLAARELRTAVGNLESVPTDHDALDGYAPIGYEDFKDATDLREWLKANHWRLAEHGKAPNGNPMYLCVHNRKAKNAVILVVTDENDKDFTIFEMIPSGAHQKLRLYKMGI